MAQAGGLLAEIWGLGVAIAFLLGTVVVDSVPRAGDSTTTSRRPAAQCWTPGGDGWSGVEWLGRSHSRRDFVWRRHRRPGRSSISSCGVPRAGATCPGCSVQDITRQRTCHARPVARSMCKARALRRGSHRGWPQGRVFVPVRPGRGAGPRRCACGRNGHRDVGGLRWRPPLHLLPRSVLSVSALVIVLLTFRVEDGGGEQFVGVDEDRAVVGESISTTTVGVRSTWRPSVSFHCSSNWPQPWSRSAGPSRQHACSGSTASRRGSG